MIRDTVNIIIERGQGISISRQIYSRIRDQILKGSLAPGTALPATRYLAKQLSVSRNAVIQAYEQLHAEGFVNSRQGAYTRVSLDTFYGKYQGRTAPASVSAVPKPVYDIAFKTGVPDAGRFPGKLWGNYLKAASMALSDMSIAYDVPEGNLELRRVIADYLFRVKGIDVVPDHIVITSGATQALSLLSSLLYEPGCSVLIEDPSSYGAIQIFKHTGFGLDPVTVGFEQVISSAPALDPAVKMIYTTPSHQFPMGRIMPAAVRLGLLEIAAGSKTYIVEDDYDSEFRYEGAPVYPFKALAPDRVVYIGSFSKVLSPGLRVGYTVLPPSLINRYKTLKRFSDAQSPMIEQAALMNFIRDGEFERHLYKMKRIYHQKRDLLIEALTREFGDRIRVYGENAGLHMVVEFLDHSFADQAQVIHNRVMVPSVDHHAIQKGIFTRQLVFGYGNLSLEEISQGITQLNGFKPAARS